MAAVAVEEHQEVEEEAAEVRSLNTIDVPNLSRARGTGKRRYMFRANGSDLNSEQAASATEADEAVVVVLDAAHQEVEEVPREGPEEVVGAVAQREVQRSSSYVSLHPPTVMAGIQQ